MAKQRPQPRPKGQASAPARPSAPGASSSAGSRSPSSASSPSEAPARPPRRSTYVEAVAVYEQGVEALQKHDFARRRTVAGVGSAPLSRGKRASRARPALPEHLPPAGHTERAAPQTVDERLYAATLAINGGRYDEAIAHLRLVRDEDPDNDHALYMLAVAHAQRGEHAEALAHLERAIALNPENRALARRDPDLETLRDDEAFQATLETTSRFIDRKRALRPKSIR